ncbi:crotonase/enoyl-CoA hydratase family protein [Candidatus Litorirhabdus singularis]|uniref:crotonase/enoyl-CoA hydratase family protein n=1 Tax=Candidatus Litorirhabdus singularis TaxID=2518993 RepID=UPI00242E13F7|nr:crotonase/enoyl-CoA hydratase family protein [Candidatus Litorirhabdus singularis]
MSKIRVEKAGRVTTVIIDRPEVRNAVDAETAALLSRAFRDFDADPKADVAVLYGEHGFFCAGADLKAVASQDSANKLSRSGDGPMGPSRMQLTKPVIAAVAGPAVAGGLELALWCDLRVVETTAVFGVYCRRWGVPLIDGGTVRLPRLIGHSRAMDMILTGRAVAAEEALVMGLANRVVDPGTARAEAEKLALQISAFPQACMRSDRRSAHEQWDMSFDKAIVNEYDYGYEVVKSGETLSGATRFAEGAGRHGSFEE